MAVEPKSRADKEKLELSLAALAAEDPTCMIRTDEETGQTIMSGMGELHLEILKDRMLREFKVEASTGSPMVAYRETVTGAGAGEHRFDREIAGKRQFAHVVVSVSSAVRGMGNVVEFAVSDDLVPKEYRDSVEAGIHDGLYTGVLGRYPITDVVVKIVGGSYDPNFSTDVAFRTASRMAFRDAVMDASPEFLEPLMTLEIIAPSEYMGDVLGDLSGRRGKIREIGIRGTSQVIHAGVPLAEMFGYATVIRSLTKGRAIYTLEPEQFAVVPADVRKKLLNG
jgi:elongation factor G